MYEYQPTHNSRHKRRTQPWMEAAYNRYIPAATLGDLLIWPICLNLDRVCAGSDVGRVATFRYLGIKSEAQVARHSATSQPSSAPGRSGSGTRRRMRQRVARASLS